VPTGRTPRMLPSGLLRVAVAVQQRAVTMPTGHPIIGRSGVGAARVVAIRANGARIEEKCMLLVF
jgi:hypothetical protein